MKTQRERAEARRNQRLEDVERQVRGGSLVIRSMTEEERTRFPAPDPNRPQRGRRRWPTGWSAAQERRPADPAKAAGVSSD